MNRWVLLLRGVNVGGNAKLPMADLRTMLMRLGLRNVSTLIQSGNAVFTGIIDADGFEGLLEDEIEQHFGFRSRVMIFSSETFLEIASGFPFPEAQDNPKTGHIWFLADPAPRLSEEVLENLAADTERTAQTEHAFYLHAPDGIGRSKLAASVERLLGVPATARNLNTVTRLAAMLDALPRG